MRTFWALKYTVARYMGEGFSVCINGPRDEKQPVCSLEIERLSGDFGASIPIDGKETSVASLEITTGEALRLFDALAEAKVKAIPHVAYGIDGETHTLRFISGSNVITYEWFNNLPPAWQELQPCVEALTRLSERIDE